MNDVRTAELKQALAIKEPASKPTIYQLIERQRPAIEKALPKAIGAERFTRLVLTEVRRNPQLLDCSPESLLGSMMLAAQLGLEPGPLGQVYLVPFKREVTFIVGYKGLIALARRSGELRDIETGVVREGDAFTYRKGTRRFLDHTENLGERGQPYAYYAVARLKGGGIVFEILTPDQIEAHMKRSPSAMKGVGPWITDAEAMARKTCVRALAPYLPLEATAGRALEADEKPQVFDVEATAVEAVEESDGQE